MRPNRNPGQSLPKKALRSRGLLKGAACLLALPLLPLQADDVFFRTGVTNVTQTSVSWQDVATTPVAPAFTDVGVFGAGVQGTLSLTENVTLAGLRFSGSPAITINALTAGTPEVLTLGASGIVVEAGAGNVTLNHGVALAENQAWTVGVGRTLNVSGVISGNGTLNLASANGAYATGFRFSGTQANTFTGLTTITSGALILSKTAGVNAIAGNITANGNPANIILENNEQIANTSIVTMQGGSKLILNGFTETIGGLQGSGSTSLVQSTESGTGRASKLIIDVADTLTYNYAGAILRDQSSGTGNALSIEKTGLGTQILEGHLRHTGTTTVTNGTLIIRATGNTYHDALRSINNWQSAIVNNATLNLQHTNATAFTENLGVVISGSGRLIKSGAGRINLTNVASVYTGITEFQQGALGVASLSNYGVNSSLGNRAADAVGDVGLLFKGGTLSYTGATAQTTNRAIRLGVTTLVDGFANVGGIEASGSTPEATVKFLATSSPDLFEGTASRIFNLSGSNAGMNEFHLQLTDQDATNRTLLNKGGAGTWYLMNTNNTYTGTTIFSGGILNVASLANGGEASSLGFGFTAAGPAGLNRVSLLFRGGTLQYTGSTAQTTNRAIRISTTGGAFIDASGSTPDATLSFTAATSPDLYENGGTRQLTLTGSNTGNNTFNIQLTNQDNTSGRTTLNKTGLGTWVLTNASGNANNYTGDTNILQGTLATRGFGIGDGSRVVLANEATANLRLDANETIGGLSGGGTTGGTVNLQGFTLTVANATDHTFAGVITGTGIARADDLIKTGAGTLFLTGTNSTYNGFTVLRQGILNVAKLGNLGENSSIGNRASDNALSDVGIIFQGGTLQYTGDTAQSTNRSIRVSTNGGAFIDASGSNIDATLNFTAASSPDFFEASGPRQLTFTGTNAGNNTFNMAITETGGVTSVNKRGTGTWRLTGNSSYTGATTVHEGTLLVNGSSSGSAVTVAAGARLGGTGTVGGATISGVLSPGADAVAAGHGIGTLSFSQSVTLASGSSYFVQIGSGGVSDRVNIATGLTITAAGDTSPGVELTGSFTGTLADTINHTKYWIATNGGFWNISGMFSNSSAYDWAGLLYSPDFADSYTGYRVVVGGQEFAMFYDANFGSQEFGGGNDILLVAVPEPGRGMLLLSAVALLTLRRRRTRALSF